jgi:hypothetical protein
MGEVWKAHDARLDRTVAIKMLLRGAVGDETNLERFRREALTLSRLSHSGIATVFDFDSQEDHDFLVMEFVPGGTLEARLREGPLPLDGVRSIGAAIDSLSGLMHDGPGDAYYFAPSMRRRWCRTGCRLNWTRASTAPGRGRGVPLAGDRRAGAGVRPDPVAHPPGRSSAASARTTPTSRYDLGRGRL